MVFKVITLAVLVLSVMAVSHAAPEGEAPSDTQEALNKMTQLLGQFKEGFNSFVKNVSDTDTFKQIQKVGEEISSKGKEFQEKIQESIKNIGEKVSS